MERAAKHYKEINTVHIPDEWKAKELQWVFLMAVWILERLEADALSNPSRIKTNDKRMELERAKNDAISFLKGEYREYRYWLKTLCFIVGESDEQLKKIIFQKLSEAT